MSSSTSPIGTTNYQVNALGQRIRKTNTASDRVFHYDDRGHLIAETTAAGTLVKEYAWIGDAPVAVMDASAYRYVHVDHLDTPRLVADATGATVWQWDQQEPFGGNWANENPGGAGIFDMPLRFPGQYFDAETGLHYNYFRDYDPSLGRYRESDPLGLLAGVNTYAYGDAKPLHLTDRLGLEPGTLPQRGYPLPDRKSICGADDGRKFQMDFAGWSFETPCRIHDNCYSICRKPRSTCDDEFLADAMRECSRIPAWIAIIMRQGHSCQATATQYYWALRGFGEPAYRTAQAKCKGCS
jgi:RHS repeat-associated protein